MIIADSRVVGREIKPAHKSNLVNVLVKVMDGRSPKTMPVDGVNTFARDTIDQLIFLESRRYSIDTLLQYYKEVFPHTSKQKGVENVGLIQKEEDKKVVSNNVKNAEICSTSNRARNMPKGHVGRPSTRLHTSPTTIREGMPRAVCRANGTGRIRLSKPRLSRRLWNTPKQRN